MNIQEFIHMGGYAGYVWSAVGLTVFILVSNIVLARRALRLEWQRLQRLYSTAETHGENT